MKPVALVSLSIALVASIGAIVLKTRAIAKAGASSKRDMANVVMLCVFILILIANIVLTALYF